MKLQKHTFVCCFFPRYRLSLDITNVAALRQSLTPYSLFATSYSLSGCTAHLKNQRHPLNTYKRLMICRHDPQFQKPTRVWVILIYCARFVTYPTYLQIPRLKSAEVTNLMVSINITRTLVGGHIKFPALPTKPSANIGFFEVLSIRPKETTGPSDFGLFWLCFRLSSASLHVTPSRWPSLDGPRVEWGVSSSNWQGSVGLLVLF